MMNSVHSFVDLRDKRQEWRLELLHKSIGFIYDKF